MKKILTYHVKLSTILFLLFVLNKKLPAQSTKSITDDSSYSEKYNTASPKSMIETTTHFHQKNNSEKLNRSFKEHFSIATPPNWIGMERNFLAYFSVNGVKQVACFSIDGTLVYTIRNFEKGHFPKFISGNVLRAYPDYSINYIKEIRATESKFHEILMESSSDFIVVQLVDEELTKLRTIKKSGSEDFTVKK